MFNKIISEALCLKLEAEAKMNSEARSCTGTLAVDPRSRDIKIANFSITFYGSELLQDTLLELNCGRRYGLVGLNGCGMYLYYSGIIRCSLSHIGIPWLVWLVKKCLLLFFPRFGQTLCKQVSIAESCL